MSFPSPGRPSRALTVRSRRIAETTIIARVARLPAFRRANMVACYLPFDGEVDLRPLILRAPIAGKEYCVPAVSRSQRRKMRFLRYRPGEHLVSNRFGIGEPLSPGSAIVSSSHIDIALMPVVGFDDSGARIGMGAGYYDRYFGRRGTVRYRHTRLVGVAFECQRLPRIDRQLWDVPLDAIVTERKVYHAAGAGRLHT